MIVQTVTITKEGLAHVLAEWERENRSGECMTEEQALELTVENRAELSADLLWQKLQSLPALIDA